MRLNGLRVTSASQKALRGSSTQSVGWLSLALVAVVSVFWILAPSVAAAADAVCSATNRASVSLANGQAVDFAIDHGDQTFDQQLAFTYAGCSLTPTTVPKASLILPDKEASSHQTATFQDMGDGVAFVHLKLDGSRLADGKQSIQVVIQGSDVVTSVTPITVTHQYSTLWLTIIVAVAAWLIGLYIAAAHADSATEGNPRFRDVAGILWHHKLSAVITIGAAYAAYRSSYFDNASFKGGFESLISLGAKVGAATIAALAITTTAGSAARVVSKKVATH